MQLSACRHGLVLGLESCTINTQLQKFLSILVTVCVEDEREIRHSVHVEVKAQLIGYHFV